jgi:Leucine-rich repeat (LRR) protein
MWKLIHLKWVNLSHNCLKSLKPALSSSAGQPKCTFACQVVQASHNRLQHIDGIIEHSPNLQQLDLSKNQVGNLIDSPFLFCFIVFFLFFPFFLKITQLENLNKVPNLIYLDVSKNKIAEVDEMHLSSNPLLGVLNLEANLITKFPHFANNPLLSTLNLKNNHLRYSLKKISSSLISD